MKALSVFGLLFAAAIFATIPISPEVTSRGVELSVDQAQAITAEFTGGYTDAPIATPDALTAAPPMVLAAITTVVSATLDPAAAVFPVTVLTAIMGGTGTD